MSAPIANRDAMAGFSAPICSAVCACVHPDAFECARIRDGRHARDDDDYHRRACECCCHNDEDYDEED